MKQPSSFAEAVAELDFVGHIPTRLILAHLVEFYGVAPDVAYNLWNHYKEANVETVDIIREYVDAEKYPPEPPLDGQHPSRLKADSPQGGLPPAGGERSSPQPPFKGGALNLKL